MKKIALRMVLWMVLCMALGCAQWAWGALAPWPQPLHLTQAELAQGPLDAERRPPAQVQRADLPANWAPVDLPHAQRHDIVGQAAQAMAGPDPWVVTWYRIRLPQQAEGQRALWLYGARSKAYGPIAVYADGQLIGQWQLDDVRWYWAPFWLPIQAGGGKVAPHELLVRMAHPAHTRTALASMWLGPPEAIEWRHLGRELLQVTVPEMGGGAFLAVGLFAFSCGGAAHAMSSSCSSPRWGWRPSSAGCITLPTCRWTTSGWAGSPSTRCSG